MNDDADLITYILTDGRHGGMQALIDGLGLRLHARGMALMRLRLGMRTTHPLTTALSFIWESDHSIVAQVEAPHGLETRDSYIGSPMAIVARTQEPFRRRLHADPPSTDDHRVLHELVQRGATDYFALPLNFVTGSSGTLMFVCNGPGGFSDDDITLFHRLAEAIAPVAEARSNHHLAEAIATSYLGARTGRRVLAGQITRGDIETIDAAVFFSDIRGWTHLNATRPASDALAIANQYFEVMSDAVDRHDGEILKFTGDGVLAVFPSEGTEHGRKRACTQALSAAQAALRIAEDTALPVPFGVGIHAGEVLYGNVGARARIDFTVLGQAVNIAARVEAFCGRLGVPILLSDPVAKLVAAPLSEMGAKEIKGLDAPMTLHTPARI